MRSKPFTVPVMLARLADEGKLDTFAHLDHCKFEGDMRAVLFSNFPDRYLHDSIIPKLGMRGVIVDRVALPRHAAATSPPDPAPDSAVLFMHELASHSENDAVKEFAERAGLPMICISRKAALWDNRLPHIEVSVPASVAGAGFAPAAPPKPEPKSRPEPEPKPRPEPAPADSQTHTGDANMPTNTVRAVPNELIEPMLRHMMRLHGQSVSYDQMVPELRQYWKHGSLDKGPQLYSYLGNILNRSDCPQFYKDWVAAGRPKEGEKKETNMNTKTTADKPSADSQPSRPGPRHGPRPLFLRALDDKSLAKITAKVMEMRDKGKQYNDILPMVAQYWGDGQGPQTGEQLAKFLCTVVASPRASAEFRSWYANVRKQRPKAKPAPKSRPSRRKRVVDKFDLPNKPPAKDDAELARIYAEENEALKRRVAELQSAQPRDVGQIREQLRELFASCQKLVSLGAMDVEGTFNMVFQFLDRA